MKDEQDILKKLLKDELESDADRTIAEVEADESLKDIALPEDMDANLAAKIKQYQREQEVYAGLSEEDQKAMRIGKEFLFQQAADGLDSEPVETKETKHEEAPATHRVVKYRKRRRMAFLLVALVAVGVMAVGMTSIGDAPFISTIKKQLFGDREMVQIDSNKENANEESGGSIQSGVDKEEEVYQKIKNKLGFDAVRFGYTPEGTTFIDGKFDENTQEAFLLYNINGNILEYKILTVFRDKSLGYDIEDELVEEYTLSISGETAEVRHYKVLESNEDEFVAQFQHNDIHYILRGILDKQELEKILNNLENL